MGKGGREGGEGGREGGKKGREENEWSTYCSTIHVQCTICTGVHHTLIMSTCTSS